MCMSAINNLFTGSPHAPNSFTCKIILALFWFVVVVILATFSANLVAFLAVSRGDLPFHTLDEVAEDRTHILQLPDNSLTVTLLQVRTGLWEGSITMKLHYILYFFPNTHKRYSSIVLCGFMTMYPLIGHYRSLHNPVVVSWQSDWG